MHDALLLVLVVCLNEVHHEKKKKKKSMENDRYGAQSAMKVGTVIVHGNKHTQPHPTPSFAPWVALQISSNAINDVVCVFWLH